MNGVYYPLCRYEQQRGRASAISSGRRAVLARRVSEFVKSRLSAVVVVVYSNRFVLQQPTCSVFVTVSYVSEPPQPVTHRGSTHLLLAPTHLAHQR